MALIECPECKKTISDQAKVCVGCGFPIKQDVFDSARKNMSDLVTPKEKDNPDKIPFYVLVKADTYIAVDLLEDHAGDEIQQLQENGFEIVSYKCMAIDHAEAIKLSTVGFGWWNTWAILVAISSCILFIVTIGLKEILIPTISLLSLICSVLVMKMNKYAFLISTLITLNPLIWLINGVYLKNRWSHPTVNKTNKAFKTDS